MIPGITRLWIARFLIGLVTFINLQCAAAFLITPQGYAPGFELSGETGNGMVRGMGILFLMWNVPYLAAIFNPTRRRLSLFEAVTMQAIGLAGETFLLLSFQGTHAQIRATLGRFALFDGLGLVALVAAAWTSRHRNI